MTATPWMHVFVDVPQERLGEAQHFWAAATGAEASAPWPGHSEFTSLRSETGDPYVHVQRIDDGEARVHLDLLADDIDLETERLAALGARRGDRHEWWQVMRSPGGFPFCVCGDPVRTKPVPVTWPTGHRSRVVQLCLDVPAGDFEAEVGFWREATGWAFERMRRGEFESLVPPSSSPVKLLLQRLGPDDGRTSTTAHIDLGTDDVDAEVARLVDLGATDVEQPADRGGWHVLEDPVGLRFCVTGRPPD